MKVDRKKICFHNLGRCRYIKSIPVKLGEEEKNNKAGQASFCVEIQSGITVLVPWVCAFSLSMTIYHCL